MDARPILATLARVLNEHGLEAILIGNAAAALHGAPITTIDFDFLFRGTPRNLAKLKAVAKSLEAVVMRPFYPASGLFRVMRDEDGLQADFMTTIDGVKSFAGLSAQSQTVRFGKYSMLVASMTAVIASKRAAGRPRDKAVLDTLERLSGKSKPCRKQRLAAPQAESDRALVDMIRRLLAKPMQERTHFLRKKIGYRASCL